MVKKIIKLLVVCLALLVVVVGISVGSIVLGCTTKSTPSTFAYSDVPESLVMPNRKEEQSFLTFPEWQIVYSSDEYAQFISTNPPSGFPYLSASGQYWSAYCSINRYTSSKYPFNAGNFLMLQVIGLSQSFEYALKAIYENSFGRLTEMLSFGVQTEEDVYASATATDFAHFIHSTPWYRYPYDQKLAGLWSQTHLMGPGLIRKWERKQVLSLEYAIKSVYGKIIKSATQGIYDQDDPTITAWLTALDDSFLITHPEIKLQQKLPENTYLVTIPRYQVFTDLIPVLAKENISFISFAGNHIIQLTLIIPQGQSTPYPSQTIFSHSLLITPQSQRVGIAVPITDLSSTLNSLSTHHAVLEHIYDY